MRLLLIEDDHMMSSSLKAMFEAEKIICDITALGEDGLEIGKMYDYDLIILDLNLPDINGYEVTRRLRSGQIHTPVLVISGMDGVEDKLKAFGIGIDDYVTKPFSKPELLARVQAVIRRSRGHSDAIIKTGKMEVNLKKKIVSIEGDPISLTPKEYAILELLSLRKGTTLTKEMFLNHLYGGIDEPELKIIDVFICKLRRKLLQLLGDDEQCIQTVWGRGYTLVDPHLPTEIMNNNTPLPLPVAETFSQIAQS